MKGMQIVPLEQMSFESFASLVKSNFSLWIDAQDSVEVELFEVTPLVLGPMGGTPQRTCENFALIFLGPADRLLPQKMYWFESPSIGRFELFIVPVSREPAGIRYQATFSRLVKSS